MSAIAKWWYRVSGQAERDEAAAIQATANRYSDTTLSLMPEILRLIEQVGIERVPTGNCDSECTPIRWPSLTGRTWRNVAGDNNCWGESGIQLCHAQERAANAFDFAESAINYAERANVELNRLYCESDNLRYASNSADAARELALAAHRNLLAGQAAYAEHVRTRDAELAPADVDLPPLDLPAPAPVPVEQPILVADWPMRQRKEAQP